MTRRGKVGRDSGAGYNYDFVTFFFSNFSHGMGERDMVNVFQKWARVKEVFISSKLNKWGRRFGFVSFYDVKNVVRLERELDHIYIGNRKLHVNILKYRRYQEGTKREERRAQGVKYEEERNKFSKETEHYGKQRSKEKWVEKNRSRSYVDVVVGEPKKEWKGLSFSTQQCAPLWLAKSVVGKLGGSMDFEKLEEEIVKGGMSMVRVRYLGDDLVLVSQ